MYVALDKPTAVKMYKYISEYWKEYLKELNEKVTFTKDENLRLELKNKLKKTSDTEICVVVSPEQNEIDKFKKFKRTCY